MRRVRLASTVLMTCLLAACAPAVKHNPLATWVPSDNYNARQPIIIVIHATEQDGVQQSLDTLRTRNSGGQVSAHYLIGRDGQRYQLVDDLQRAWHAGSGRWGSITDLNSASIGIELDNNGEAAFPPAQIQSLLLLLRDLCDRYNIPPTQIVAHADFAPTRKQDPGPRFPWQQLAAAGFGIWPAADAPSAPAGFDPWNALRVIGYPLDDRAATVRAFHRHFRGSETDMLDDEDLRILHSLLQQQGY
ncbi:N-acetylmuramoyl-L-alanine amidase [Pseudoxanthomonas dokdonensis]|nr:N-acetylmuramoyl-L-alanine amidase [Pseudoxanthomonas dokdonensis]